MSNSLSSSSPSRSFGSDGFSDVTEDSETGIRCTLKQPSVIGSHSFSESSSRKRKIQSLLDEQTAVKKQQMELDAKITAALDDDFPRHIGCIWLPKTYALPPTVRPWSVSSSENYHCRSHSHSHSSIQSFCWIAFGVSEIVRGTHWRYLQRGSGRFITSQSWDGPVSFLPKNPKNWCWN